MKIVEIVDPGPIDQQAPGPPGAGSEQPSQPQPRMPVAQQQPPVQPQPAQPKPIHRLLVIVHPGSACGSADFNLGKYDGRAAREHLAYEINGWQDGNVLVIDGDLSDELPDYPNLDQAIKKALNDARTRGQIAMRVRGDDSETPDQVDRTRQFINKYKLNPAEWRIDLTGAWMEQGDSGCVRSVLDEFERHGFRAFVMDSAVWLNEEDPDEKYESDE